MQTVHATIGKGLLILLGIETEDTVSDAEKLCAKIPKMRIFSDENGLMNLSNSDVDGEYLVVESVHPSCRYPQRESPLLHQSRPSRTSHPSLREIYRTPLQRNQQKNIHRRIRSGYENCAGE